MRSCRLHGAHLLWCGLPLPRSQFDHCSCHFHAVPQFCQPAVPLSVLAYSMIMFRWHLCIPAGFFLMLGTVGWRASLAFVRHIYKVSLLSCHLLAWLLGALTHHARLLGWRLGIEANVLCVTCQCCHEHRPSNANEGRLVETLVSRTGALAAAGSTV